jgi:hypothetical protein
VVVTTLDAGFVYDSEDDDVILVGFADKEYGTAHYVLLQRSKQVSAEEEALGQGEVHITVDDQDRSAYGGIERLVLDDSGVRIRLHRDTAAMLATEHDVVIRFQGQAADVVRLQKALQLLFAGRDDVLFLA